MQKCTIFYSTKFCFSFLFGFPVLSLSLPLFYADGLSDNCVVIYGTVWMCIFQQPAFYICAASRLIGKFISICFPSAPLRHRIHLHNQTHSENSAHISMRSPLAVGIGLNTRKRTKSAQIFLQRRTHATDHFLLFHFWSTDSRNHEFQPQKNIDEIKLCKTFHFHYIFLVSNE